MTPPSPDEITFFTGNAGKLQEMQELLEPLGIEVVQDDRDVPEIQHDRLHAVTEAGAGYLAATGAQPPFLLEDAGLFVAALRGFPGVYSRHALDTIGLEGILDLLRDAESEMRAAAFRADLCYLDADGEVHHFDGTCTGRIARRPRGQGGFGFDPIFEPDEQPEPAEPKTFAELAPETKNRLSHRGRAAAALRDHLQAES